MVEYNTNVLFGADKIEHFTAFALISLFASIMVSIVTAGNFRLKGLAVIWFTLVMIGILEEYRQYFLPNRTAELWDAMANLLGVSAGMLLPFLVCIKKEARPIARYFLVFLIILLPFLLGLAELNERHFIVGLK